ncbi:MAG: rhodanese-like domain-containing protein [Gammaproteobacteria bacterium]|nr:rhodanese-like domain-containing protein [Gammaproteobacteria bacterium]
MENVGEFVVNHWILASSFVVLAYLVMSDSLSRKLSGITPVGSAQAIQIVNQQKGLFLDVREKSEFAKEHIAESVNIPLAKLAEDSSLKDASQPIILICVSGQRSRTAAKQLHSKGFSDVYVLSGGLNTWKEAKLPLFS